MRVDSSICVRSANAWLGITINHDVLADTLSISYEINIMEALNDFGLTDFKPMNTPAAPDTKLIRLYQLTTLV
jgi:hypothetical protein